MPTWSRPGGPVKPESPTHPFKHSGPEILWYTRKYFSLPGKEFPSLGPVRVLYPKNIIGGKQQQEQFMGEGELIVYDIIVLGKDKRK